MKKYTFIINPTAGKGRGKKIAPELKSILEKFGCSYQLIFTKQKNDAHSIVENLPKFLDHHIIAVGGDGTVNEIVNGLNCNTEISFGVLPIGSGNDFARSIDQLDDWKVILYSIIQSEKSQIVDLGLIKFTDSKNNSYRSRHFACNCGIGFDAHVAYLANKNSILRGLPLYLLSVFRTMKIFKSSEYSGYFDNYLLSGKKLLIAIGNGITSGGGFRLNPNAKNNDGLLDYCIANDMSKTSILKVLPKAINGTHLHSEFVNYGQFVEADITIAGTAFVHIDGEVISDSANSIKLQIIPKALKIIVRN